MSAGRETSSATTPRPDTDTAADGLERSEDVERTACLEYDRSGSTVYVSMHTCPICGRDPTDADTSTVQHFSRDDHTMEALRLAAKGVKTRDGQLRFVPSNP